VHGTIRAIRGAIQVEADEPELVLGATADLLAAVIEANRLSPDDIISLVFTATPDLRSAFPAAAARRSGLGAVPLLCAAEIDVPGALPRVVRLLAQVEFPAAPAEVRHVHLNGAQVLRPDLAAAAAGAATGER